MILVVGSTGILGSEVCRLLAEGKQPFKALVRPTSDPGKVEYLNKLGAQVVLGDVREPETLALACKGVQTVISTISAMPRSYQPGQNDVEKVDRQGVMALIDAAKAAGVKQFIYTSFSKNMDEHFPLRNAKRAVEQHLQKSGLVYTILRPSYFMEGWLSPAVGFDAAAAKAQIYGTGDQPISWISYKDVARFAVESITNPKACDQVLELGGPTAVSPNQAVRLFEQKLGKTFEVTHVPVEALQGQYHGAEDPMQKSFIGLMICYAGGDSVPMDQIRADFQTDPISLEAFVAG